jgi:membrane protein
MTIKDLWELLKQTHSEWTKDRGPKLSAALAYYGIFTLVPLLLLGITVVGWIYGEEAAQGQIVGQIEGYVGYETANTIQNMISNVHTSGSSSIAATVGFLTLAYAASGIFAQMQDSLNQIWKVEDTPTVGIKKNLLKFFNKKLYHFIVTLVVGFLFLLMVFVSTAVSSMNKYFSTIVPGYSASVAGEIVNIILTFGIMAGLIAVVYKNLPDIKIKWDDVRIGAIITSFLFVLGRFLISLYIGYSSTRSAYTAAGALLVIMIWIYYSAQIFYFGAELTKVYAYKYGSRKDEIKEESR